MASYSHFLCSGNISTTLEMKRQATQSLFHRNNHYHIDSCSDPLCIIISGIAGMEELFLIQSLRLLHQCHMCFAAPTGVAAFNVDVHMLHSLLALFTEGYFKDLDGMALQELQQTFKAVYYLIIDEMLEGSCWAD